MPIATSTQTRYNVQRDTQRRLLLCVVSMVLVPLSRLLSCYIVATVVASGLIAIIFASTGSTKETLNPETPKPLNP